MRGQLAAELDLEPVGAGRRHRLLQRLDVTHQVAVGDGYVVLTVSSTVSRSSRDARRVDREDVRHDAEPLVELGEGLVGHGVGSGVVDHDLGAGVAGLGEVGPQQVHPSLGGGARRASQFSWAGAPTAEARAKAAATPTTQRRIVRHGWAAE